VRLFVTVVAAALIIALGCVLLAPISAFAGVRCAGQMVSVSWFGKETCHGRPPGHGRGKCETAAGIPFDGSQMLAAHRTLPLGTSVRFTYRGRSLVLRVLDRGPWVSGRSYDLSAAAARALGTKSVGIAKVCAVRLR
jgi:rare lipoprotein A